MSLPALQPGEFANFDAADREPRYGELFVMLFDSRSAPGGAHKIVQAVRRAGEFTDGPGVAWWLRFAFEPSGCLVDGPLRAEAFPSLALGRIVAVLDTEA